MSSKIARVFVHFAELDIEHSWAYIAALYSTLSSYHADDSCIGLVYYVPVMDPVNARSRLPKVFIDTDVIRRPNEAI